MSNKPTLEQLEALQARINSDIKRSRLLDVDGLKRSDPLLVNQRKVAQQIAEIKKAK